MNSTHASALPEYDYIVVGAGSAGCIVAGELAQDPSVRVLVLEPGDAAEDNPETLAAAEYKEAFINPRLMWDRYSVPQPECADHRLFMGSGRGVGGSGAINAMVYLRGAEHDYRQWNTRGWQWSDVVPDFERLEARLGLGRQPPTRFADACIRAAVESGFQHKDDFHDGRLSGYLGYEWMNQQGGERRHSYAAFLKPLLGRPNLTIATHATVHRIRCDGERRARVVEYLDEGHGGQMCAARARREIVLCAGALATPRILLLSGIGPGRELQALGIPVVADSPGVGRNLHDHPNVILFFKGRQPTDCTWAQLYGFHRAHPNSDLAPGEADTCYVFYSARSSFREGMIRLLPGMMLPEAVYGLGWPVDVVRSGLKSVFQPRPVRSFIEHLYGIVIILGKPKSRGSVRLQSAWPGEPALIDPGYLREPEDLETLVRAVRLARRVASAPALATWGNFELMPGPLARSDAAIERFVRKNIMTTYHYAGTCRMGDDEDAVVDGELRVRGVRGLRVADASVIPFTPVSAMNAPSMLVGYRAARLLRGERLV
ncbi:MAG TPA: GMC family oxidoreductase N-terminal domain-containing protein [Polyangia bacterium]|nr:GMC family oxidoreductase N-terminal domain-containing protein [Polyangia bacterium]